LMENIKIVKVTDNNLIVIVESLARAIWREHYTPIIGKEQVEYMLEKFQTKDVIVHQIEQEGYSYFVLVDNNGNAVGYLGVIPKEDGLFLSKLYISSEHRGKSYGKCAIEFIEAMARDRNFSKVNLTVNKQNINSIKIYKKCGFVITESLVIFPRKSGHKEELVVA
jgi:diamine N-acetyltransferase